MAALKELFIFPLKIFLALSNSLQIVADGWNIGLVNLLGSSFQRIHHFFTYELTTDSNLFFAVGFVSRVINHFEGALFGTLIRKFLMLTFPYELFKSYEDHNDSPHNADMARNIDTVYKNLKDTYGSGLIANDANLENIHTAIAKFLDDRMTLLKKDNTTEPEEIKFLEAAQRCLAQFKIDYNNNSAAKINDLRGAPNPLFVLYLVWTAIEKESANPQDAHKLKVVLASYLTQIQRGFNRINNPEEQITSTDDQPECLTGAIGLLLEVLKSLPNEQYKPTPTKEEGVSRMRELLQSKLDHDYYSQCNALVSLIGTSALFLPQEKFIEMERRPIKYYAQFLLHTPQGIRSCGQLNFLS